MKPETRLVGTILFMITLAANGTLYKLLQNNCENETLTKRIAMLVISFLLAFGMAFLMQKLGFKWNLKKDKEK